MDTSTEPRKSVVVAGVATLGALAFVLSTVATFSFPLLPFLEFDLAEIPDVVAFLVLGPTAGTFTTLVHWFALNFYSPTVPVIGPSMKFLAVLSMFLGFYVGGGLSDRLLQDVDVDGVLGLMFGTGMAIRVGVMSVMNFLVFWFLLPETYIPFARQTLEQVGVVLTSDLEVVGVTILFAAVYNAAHVALSLIPSSFIVKGAVKAAPQLGGMAPWLRSRSSERQS